MTSSPRKSRKKALDCITVAEDSTTMATSSELNLNFLTNEPGTTLNELRNEEIWTILDCLNNFSLSIPNKVSNVFRMLLLIGNPATGKTSCIKYSINTFVEQARLNSETLSKIKEIKVFQFNANSLKKCDEVISEFKKLENRDLISKILMRNHVINIKNQNTICLVHIEELDTLTENNKKQISEFFESFFSQETKEKHLYYFFIGATNKINLDEELKQVVKTLKIKKIMFEHYSSAEYVKILMRKIETTKEELKKNVEVSEKTIMFIVTKLIDNKKADTRLMLEIIKQIFIFVRDKTSSNILENNKVEEKILIGLSDLLKMPKIKSMLIDPIKENALKLTLKQQYVLIAIYLYLKRTESLSLSFKEIVEEYMKLREIAKSKEMNYDEEIKLLTEQLESANIITKTQKNKKIQSCTNFRLNISSEDIKEVFQNHEIFSGYFPN